MKVIFLDIDGVLNSDEYFDKIKDMNIKGIENDVDVNKIVLLKKSIDETGAKVVLTSSWRYKRKAQELKQLLLNYGILVDCTPYIYNERGIEIKKYLEEHRDVQDFVIIDDEMFDSYDENLIKKLIKISNTNGINFGDGLQPKHIQQIIQKLGRKEKTIDDELEL